MSMPATIPARLNLGGTSVATTQTLFQDFSAGYDYAIAGIPFISAAGPQQPLTRKGIPIQKPRQDFEEEPGEQTFQAWWTRAQSSFHCGAGLTFRDIRQSSLESDTSLFEHFRFQTSKGVDVWTPGKVQLLSSAPVAKTGTTPFCVAGVDGSGNNFVLVADGTAVVKVVETLTPDGNGVLQPTYANTTVSWTGTGTCLALCTDGHNYYAADAAGIYKGSVDTPATAATKIYNLSSVTGAILAWSKQRLVYAENTASSSKVYALDANAAAASPLPTAVFTHPNALWVWTTIEEGPAAIYAAGYAGEESAAYAFVLQSNGDFPVLTTGSTAIQMPPGERILGLKQSMGTVMGVATNKGFRLGIFSSAQIGLGPQIIVGTCYGAMTARDRFLYVGYKDADGHAGLARIDAGRPLSHQLYSYSPEQLYAWAPDLRAEDGGGNFLTGAVSSASVMADRVVFTVTGQGTFVQHPSSLVASGSILSSRQRMNTLELKLPRFIRVRSEPSYGTLSVGLGYETDTANQPSVTISPQFKQDSGDILLTSPPASWVTVTATLTRDTRADRGPVFSGFQLKVLPVVNKQRLMQLPVVCMDFEISRTGDKLGINPAGNALSRLLALEAHENAGDIVAFQILAKDAAEAYTDLVTIEEIQFVQTAGPFEQDAIGANLLITLRTVQ